MPQNTVYDAKWIFFDIGSTLVDESECYKDRYEKAVRGSAVSPREFEQKVIEFSRQNKKGDHEAVKYYGFTLPKWNKELEKLYPDTSEALKRLREKYRLGIIANQSPGSKKRLEDWGMLEYFDVVAASAEEGFAKPDERIFLRALKSAGCLPQNAVMVGDRLDNDIAPAKKLLMKTVWIKRGFAKYNKVGGVFETADYTVNDLLELCELLGC